MVVAIIVFSLGTGWSERKEAKESPFQTVSVNVQV